MVLRGMRFLLEHLREWRGWGDRVLGVGGDKILDREWDRDGMCGGCVDGRKGGGRVGVASV